MEILAEIVFALFGGVVEFIFEILFQIIAELFGTIFDIKSKPDAERGPRRWISAGVYLSGGVLCGLLSLWIAPALWLPEGWQRWTNLVATPLIAGMILQGWDNFRARPGQPAPALPGFQRGFLFAAAMSGIRFFGGK